MVKTYRKMTTIQAEQFDSSDEMVHRYGLIDRGGHVVNGLHVDNMYFVPTLEGRMKINHRDWIATGVNGEHWSIADNVFKQTYAELPVIPKEVADIITSNKDELELFDVLDDAMSSYTGPNDWITSNQDDFARAWLDGYQVEEEDLSGK